MDDQNEHIISPPKYEQLRRYLTKDHTYRHRIFDEPRRGLIDDNFGTRNGAAG